MKLDELQTPALLVRLDRVRANVRRMTELLRGRGGVERWRPHTKTAKVPEVLQLLLEAGLRQFKTATTRETLVLLETAEKAKVAIDVLVAMSHRGANLARVAELARRFDRHRLSILTEDAQHAREVRALGAGLDLFVDLDPRMGRSGIPIEDRARIAAVVDACGDALAGLHAYEGHVRDRTSDERKRSCAPLFDALVAITREHGLEELETITSGTPTFVEALEHQGLATIEHTISPGIVVYWDRNSEALGIEGFAFAASVLSRVISAPREGRVTLDAGSKAVDAAAGDPCVELANWPNLAVQKPSEEHLPIQVRYGEAPCVGELVELLPKHVCPMVNLADRVALLEGDELVSIVPVAAHAHEIAPPDFKG